MERKKGIKGLVLVLALAGIAGAAAGCGGGTEGAAGGGAAGGGAGGGHAPMNTAVLFSERCQSCHGPDGTGGQAVALNTPEFKARYDQEKVIKRVRDGDPEKGMPACAADLSRPELERLADLVLSLPADGAVV